MSNKISLDFDGVLSEEEGIFYAKNLLSLGHELWVVTSRYGPIESSYNDKLKRVCNNLDIPSERVVFTNGESKYAFFEKNNDFFIHIDDDFVDIELIKIYTDVHAILWPDERDLIYQG